MQFSSATLLLLAVTSVSANDSENLRHALVPKNEKRLGFCEANAEKFTKKDIIRKGYKMMEEPGYQGLFCSSDVACSSDNTCLQDAHGEEDLGFCVPTFALDCMSEVNFGFGAIDKGKVAKELRTCAVKKWKSLKAIENDSQSGLHHTGDYSGDYSGDSYYPGKEDEVTGGCCVTSVGAAIEAVYSPVGVLGGIDYNFGSGANCFTTTFCYSFGVGDIGTAAAVEAELVLNFVDDPADVAGDSHSVGFDVHIAGVAVSIGIGVNCDMTDLLFISAATGVGAGVEVPWETAECQTSVLGCTDDNMLESA